MKLRDAFGTLYHDNDFADLYPSKGQPAIAPWRLALVTVFQFIENLTDRQAAHAVRARIDWKYALALQLEDPGFHYSVLSEFRTRLTTGNAETLLLDRMLEHFKTEGLVKAGGKQRTDSTHILANIRNLNRLEFLGETLRAALNDVAGIAPEWLKELAPAEWFERYGRRVEDYRLPKSKTKRQAYAETIGNDGFTLLDAISRDAQASIGNLSSVEVLTLVWQQHYQREEDTVKLRDGPDLPKASEKPVSPYDPEARHGTKRGMQWQGYKLHLTETCDDDRARLITMVTTSAAPSQDVTHTAPTQEALKRKGLAPKYHLVDGGYVDGGLLVESQERGIELVGPLRRNSSWQAKTEGAFDLECFSVDWDGKRVSCPRGKLSTSWGSGFDRYSRPIITVAFNRKDCRGCEVRDRCTRSKAQPRLLKLPVREVYEAQQEMRERALKPQAKALMDARAGVEAAFSQGARAFGLRRSRYRGMAKTQLQHVATAAAINLVRVSGWLDGGRPRPVRPSAFAALRMAA